METLKEYYYTYYSYEEWGRGYFGSRGCYCLPEEDVKYFGSFKDKTFRPTQKIILKDDYATREEALIDEIILHDYYDVAENPHFANLAKQKTTGFYYSSKGVVRSKEHKRKISEAQKGKFRNEDFVEKCKARRHSEETKKKMSEAQKGEKNHNYGKKLSLEIRKKLSLSHKGKQVWNKGIPMSYETKKKISLANKGRKQTEEHKMKRSEKKSRHFTLLTPCGKIVVGKNVSKFCEKNNLCKSQIYNLLSGKIKQYKGWTIPKV